MQDNLVVSRETTIFALEIPPRTKLLGSSLRKGLYINLIVWKMKKEGLFNYSQLLSQVKKRVALAQQRAIYAANEEMLHMYWDIGEMLEKSQMADGWGKKTLERLSVDLKNDYPKVKGFSVRNLYCMMQFYEEYNKELTLPKTSHSSIVQSPTAKLDSYTNNGNYSIVQSPIAKLDKYAKTEKYTITKSAITQLPTYNFELPVKHLPRVTFIFHIPPLYCVIT